MTEKYYITPNETIGKTDSESIQNAVNKAKIQELNRVVIPQHNDRTGTNTWTIEKTISLPDNIEIIIDNAYMVLADGVYANMFSNSNLVDGKTQLSDMTQKNITIRGIGKSILDGGSYNGLSESNSAKDGRAHISKNSTIFFCNCENVRVENLTLTNQRWWAINNVAVTHSVFRNLDFKADISRLDANGVHHPFELPLCYSEIYVKNADGIDLRIGCHDILIENITGFTEDDTVALTALSGFELPIIPPDTEMSIHDVVIKHIYSDCYVCANVRILNDDGNKVYNILIDDVCDTRTRTEYKSGATIRFGDFIYTKKTPAKLGELYNIFVSNVSSKSAHPVLIAKNLMNTTFENIMSGCGKKIFCINKQAEIQNCVFNGIKPLDGNYENLTDID